MSLDGFTYEGANNAWNDLGCYFDLGTLRSFAAVVSQSRVGLCPDGGGGFGPPHRCHSRASRTYLDFAPVSSGQSLRPPARETPLVRVVAIEVARRYLWVSRSTFILFQVGRDCQVGGERWMSQDGAQSSFSRKKSRRI